MKASVHPLAIHEHSNADIVLLLEEMLARAKNGEFVSVHMITSRLSDHSTEIKHAGEWNVFELIGQIEAFKLTSVLEMTERESTS